MRLLSLETLPADLRAAVTYCHVRANELLYRQSDPAKYVFVVLEGRMRLDNHVDGKGTIPLYVIRRGECISEAALFADRYCSDAVAEVNSHLTAFPKMPLQAALRVDAELAAEFMQMQSKRFNLIRSAMEIRSIPLARDRVLHYLFASKPSDSCRLWIDRPLKRMAYDVGLTPETFYRTMRTLEREGSISWLKNVIVLKPSCLSPTRIGVLEAEHQTHSESNFPFTEGENGCRLEHVDGSVSASEKFR